MNKSLLELVADERFIQIESLSSRPNLFKIVARTHTETWHSMFLGWLLDPSGSHGLGEFSLKRLLVALANPVLQEDDLTKTNKISKIAAIGDLCNASVTPNEDNQKEKNCSAGRIDVFVRGITCKGEEDTVLLIEQKVNAPISKEQCRKYADWLYENYPNENKILLILAPNDRLGATIEDTIGDNRWNAIDYQTLHDKVLVPVINSPDLSRLTLPLIIQYIDALRVPSNGRKLAVTEEEKELALELYEKHKEAFEAIFFAISDTVDIGVHAEAPERLTLKVEIQDELIEGKTVPDFYEKVLKYLVDNELVTSENVPFETGTKRYLIASSPIHQTDQPFRAPIDYGGFFMETNKGKPQAVKDLMRFLKANSIRVKKYNAYPN